MGVSFRGSSIWAASAGGGALVVEGAGCGDGVVGASSRAAAKVWTSSFRTRPSLPVPVTSDISTLSSFKRPRTAGVASLECLFCGLACSVPEVLSWS